MKEITDINNEITKKGFNYDLNYPCKYTMISSTKK